MSAQDSPLNKVPVSQNLSNQPVLMCDFPPQAHQHGANADEYLAQGLLIPAAEEHEKAAQAFQECLLVSADEKVCSAQMPFIHQFLTSPRRQKGRCGCYTTNTQNLPRIYNARSPNCVKKTRIHPSHRTSHTRTLLPHLPFPDPHPRLPHKRAAGW